MMKNEIPIGKNRTGVEMSPKHKRELEEGAAGTIPSTEGDGQRIAEIRATYADEAEPVGSLAPPASLKGAAGAVGKRLKGEHISVFLDKLGERLAFERTGTRLYDALLTKLAASEASPEGPTAEELGAIRAQELAHFEMLRDAIVELGADPTTVTPSADVVGVSSMGILQVVDDPRMTLDQTLEAILIAEMADNGGWSLLVELARTMGKDDLAKRFEGALHEEEEHLAKVKHWVKRATISKAEGESASA